MPRLWITRTRPQQPSIWERQLQQAGWELERLEVLATTARVWGQAELEQLHQQAVAVRAWLWTSASAVHAAAKDLAAWAAAAEQHAVGRNTAAMVEQALGQACVFPRGGHGGAAWVAEYGAGFGAGDGLLLLSGNNPRQDWLDPLRALGIGVHIATVYQRHAIDCTIPAQLADAIVATSGAALESLAKSLHKAQATAAFQRPLLLPAARLQSAARQLGWSGRMAVIPALTADGLQAALKDC